MAPGSVDAIVAIGGDGTMHEVLQVGRQAGLPHLRMSPNVTAARWPPRDCLSTCLTV